MRDELDTLATAKRPTQKRACERFERVLAAAEELLVEGGLSGFSIPLLAERLGYTRGSVYAYFPTAHALLNELAERHLGRLLTVFASSSELASLPWRRGIEAGVQVASDYYDSNPAARMLILGGAVTDSTFRAQELTIKGIGQLGRLAWQTRGIALPKEQPDVAALAIDLGVACLRRAVFEHGEIVESYRRAAAQVMITFLEPYVEGSS
jgi:AcrR family transcriptional regulator